MKLTMAWRNVWRNRTRSLIIVGSVAIGLFAGVFVLGLYEGMIRARVRKVIDWEVGHLQIHRPGFSEDYDAGVTLYNTVGIEAVLQRHPSVRAFSMRAITMGMLANATGSAGVEIIGVSVADEKMTSGLDEKVTEGQVLRAAHPGDIMVGKKLADKLGLRIGGRLVLTFSDAEKNITAGAFKVCGYHRTNNDRLDERVVYVHRETLKRYLGVPGYHEVAILLQADDLVVATQKELQQQFPQVEVKTWKENSPETDLMVGTVNQYSYIIVIIIMIALAFGIVNTMLMSVLERTREIGMLNALGMNHAQVFKLVVMETLMLTLVGVPVGMATSWLTLNYFSVAGIDISSISGAVMSGFGFESVIYPTFPHAQVGSVVAIVLVTALFSSVFPSVKAMKLQPADALRQ